MMRKILVIGATSIIAQETARIFAKDGDSFFLVGRNTEKLGAVADDLAIRGAGRVDSIAADATEFGLHEMIVGKAIESMGGMDIVLIAYGMLGDQKASQQQYSSAKQVLKINFLSVVSFLTLISNYFEERKNGRIAVISSVAGDRGRRSNYIYGTSKGALDHYLQGLRNRLWSSGVRVLTVKPGFVDTPMTAALKKGMLFASPESVGKGIYSAVVKGKDVVYLPPYWRYVMSILRHIPEAYFKRLRL